jgi:hypothetical protein
MSRRKSLTVIYLTGDDAETERAWEVSALVTFGRAATYNDPAEDDEVELHGVRLAFERTAGFGDFDNWAEDMGLTEDQIERIGDTATEQAREMVADDYACKGDHERDAERERAS